MKGRIHDAGTTGVICVDWKLFSQLYCVPGEMTDVEEGAFIQQVKEDMGLNFEACPDDFVRDRLVGGVKCPFNDSRRHVIHVASRYGFQAAAHRHYWALSKVGKAEIRRQYEESCAGSDLWVGDGPFANKEE